MKGHPDDDAIEGHIKKVKAANEEDDDIADIPKTSSLVAYLQGIYNDCNPCS
jgi:hypothetical protein